MFEIAWAGDILLADSAQPYLDQHGYEWPFEFIRPLLSADFTVGNAEGPITDRTEMRWPERRYSYNAGPESAAALAKVGFGAMSLCNNHAMDRGAEGLADTQAHLRAAGIQPFGAGLDEAEAEAPLLIDTPYGAVGVVGLGLRFGQGQLAGPAAAGTTRISCASIQRGRELAVALGARWVVAFVHWGATYQPVRDTQRRRAAVFARECYDLVIGHGPHIIQPVEVIDGMPVLYSLGNCAFGSSGRFGIFGALGCGLIARTRFADPGLVGIELTPIDTDNETVNYQTRPCGTVTEELLTALGPGAAGIEVLSVRP